MGRTRNAVNPKGFRGFKSHPHRKYKMNIVLLHGIAGSSRSFTKLLQELTIPSSSFLSFDLLGFGRNKLTGKEYTREEHCAFISREIEKRFGKEKVVLMGHSAGGVLALLWASAHPKRVEKIVIINTPLGKSKDDIRRSILRGAWSWDYIILKYPRIARALCFLLCQINLMRFFSFLRPPSVPREVFEDYRLHSWRSLENTFAHIILEIPAAPLIEKLAHIPILNIVGSEDREITKRMPREPNVSNVCIRGGHRMIFSHGTTIGKTITHFLAKK